jgi:hypothetical protein
MDVEEEVEAVLAVYLDDMQGPPDVHICVNYIHACPALYKMTTEDLRS